MEPVIAGLDAANKPFVCALDLIGAPVFTDDFVVGGTCSEQLYGMCEALYRPDMVSFFFFQCIDALHVPFPLNQ